MIKIQVYLTNSYDRTTEEVTITKEEILQLACNKVKERYEEGHWTIIRAEDIEVVGVF